jgi:hypothetical protein
MPPLDDWVAANVPADERRLTRVYLNYFGAVAEATVVTTLNAWPPDSSIPEGIRFWSGFR